MERCSYGWPYFRSRPWIRKAAALAALALVAGCARDESRTIETLGRKATIERQGETTRVTVQGLGKNSRVIDIKPQAVMDELSIPLYPGSEVVENSQQCAVDRDTGDRGCRADLRTSARFEDVVSFYRKRLRASPTTVSVGGMRTSIMVKSHGNSTRSVTVSRREASKDTRIMLLRIEQASGSMRP